MEAIEIYNMFKGISTELDKVIAEIQDTATKEAKQKLNAKYGMKICSLSTNIIMGGRATGKTYNYVERMLYEAYHFNRGFVYVNGLGLDMNMSVFTAHKNWEGMRFVPLGYCMQVKFDGRVLGLSTNTQAFFSQPEKFLKATNIIIDDIEVKDDNFESLDYIEDWLKRNGFQGMVYMVGRGCNYE